METLGSVGKFMELSGNVPSTAHEQKIVTYMYNKTNDKWFFMYMYYRIYPYSLPLIRIIPIIHSEPCVNYYTNNMYSLLPEKILYAWI